ncbi:MAG: AAA family ATPase [Burkholderiaceae bacterium]|jgi:type II secretory pathway predicted ATPase ExeA|nr:AAA family ATPase [Burkholderiales bacterium]MCZ8100904.1 AAA family ATPase [Burkholderiales bacterium]MCZ8339593.1 AAA family ATPase [Burkholderiaceae bacterium]
MAASLYWKHFGLTSAPFPVTPTDDAFYSGGTRKATVHATLHVLRNETGIVKVVGEAGTGKTTLCRQLTRELRDRYTVVYTCDPSLGGDQTWFALADALRLAVDRADPRDAAARVRARIADLHRAGSPVLLLVDEAHALPGETREQFRLLAQHGADGERMRIVLLGPDELDHDLALPAMDALRTRIAHSIRLKRLKLSDIDKYLHFRMRAAGWSGAPVFNANAVRAIARLSAGIPRRINVIADKALLSAAMDRRHQVGARDVAAAADEIKLSRRRTGAPQWSLAGAAFAVGIVVAVSIGTLAWHLLRPHASAPQAAGTPELRASAAARSSEAAPAASPAPATAQAAAAAASATTRTATPVTRQPPLVDPPGYGGAVRDPANLGGVPLILGELPAPRFVQDLGAVPLTLGQPPAPRFVQDIGPAPTGSN